MELLPFNSVTACPACGHPTYGSSVRFSATHVIQDLSGGFVVVSTNDDEPKPHLEKKCKTCGFGWLEHIADGKTVQGIDEGD